MRSVRHGTQRVFHLGEISLRHFARNSKSLITSLQNPRVLVGPANLTKLVWALKSFFQIP
jgi:hypothetical protein